MLNHVNASKRLAAVKLLLVATGTLAVALCLGFAASSCQGGYSGPAEPIVLGTMANAGDTLIFIADDQKYFADNGLSVTLKTYDSGLAATNAMLGGEADLAYATEFVIVGKSLQNQKIGIVTTYSKNQTVAVVGRNDRRIEAVSDLKGKTVGLARGTINEFYLGRLLALNGLRMNDVTLVNIKLTELEESLGTGRVDAVVAGSRNLQPVIQKQAGRVFVWSAHSGQPAYGTLASRNDWVARHPETVKRLLKSLAQAEQYVNRNPDRARAAVQKRLNYDDEYMASVWSEYQFGLSLDQSLILAMEDEARWMIANSLTGARQVPDFLDYVYEDALKAIKREAVNVIR